MTLDCFIDNFSDIIDIENTDELVFQASRNLSSDDIRKLSRSFLDLGLSLYKHLEDNFDFIRMFNSDYTLEDLQAELYNAFYLNLSKQFFSRYALNDIIRLFEKEEVSSDITVNASTLYSIDWRSEYFDNGHVGILVDQDDFMLVCRFISSSGVIQEIYKPIDETIFVYNPNIGIAIKKKELMRALDAFTGYILATITKNVKKRI